jgi:hypothetical protein
MPGAGERMNDPLRPLTLFASNASNPSTNRVSGFGGYDPAQGDAAGAAW